VSIRTLLLAPSRGDLDRLASGLPGRSEGLVISQVTGAVPELKTALLGGEIDVAVAQLEGLSDSDLAQIEQALNAHAGVSLILVTRETSAELLLRAMRAGIREVVSPEVGDQALESALSRQIERMSAARAPARKGRVVALMPAKGGSGATFLATNLAYALAARGLRVALLDMNLQFGDVALFITDKRPPTNIADLSRDIQRLDAALLEASMMQVADHLWILAAPESPERSVDVRPEVVERIISLARSQFDFVILDVGRVLESVSIRALDDAELIYLVLQAALPTLNDARRLISVLGGLGYGRDKVKIVVNRASKGGDISLAEIAKALGHEVAMQVPNSYENVVYSINHGVPILKQTPKDPVARALAEWAEELAPPHDKRGGWLRGIFGARG